MISPKLRPEMASHPLAKAAREVNQHAEVFGFKETALKYGVQPDDLIYMAEQRALRVVRPDIFKDGGGHHAQVIDLTESEEQLLQRMTVAYCDGLLIGYRAKDFLSSITLGKQTR